VTHQRREPVMQALMNERSMSQRRDRRAIDITRLTLRYRHVERNDPGRSFSVLHGTDRACI